MNPCLLTNQHNPTYSQCIGEGICLGISQPDKESIMAITVSINGQTHDIDLPEDTPLLWVIRDHLNLTGTKFGCGIAQCGACTVHMNGQPIRACVTPLQVAQGQTITTIEGIDTPEALALQNAWDTLNVVQCGYCQSGQIMSAAALLKQTPSPNDVDIDAYMAGNICRCATYVRVRAGIKLAASKLAPALTPKQEG